MLASPVWAAKVGDPIDGNDGDPGDGTGRTLISVEDDCVFAYEHPACGWCWQVCLYAMMLEDFASGGITWQWGS